MSKIIITIVGKSFDDMAKELEKVGEDIGVTIRCQREEIFTSMHRI